MSYIVWNYLYSLYHGVARQPASLLRIHDGFRKSTSPRSNISKSVNSCLSQIYAYISIKIKKN